MAICYDRYGRAYNCYGSGWYNWGRWVLLGILILAAVFIFFCFRRKAGRRPMYGTGWAAAAPGHGQPNYNPNYNNQQAPPQQYNNYNQQPQGGYGQNQSYFGGQQTGVDAPQQSYQPPSGPPPGKY